MEQKAHPLNLGHLGQKVPEYAVRPVRPKMERLALFYLGYLGHARAKYAVREFRPKRFQLALFDFGTVGTKTSDGPENGTTSGISAIGEQNALRNLGH
ncbi:hypothetical protein KI387_018117, partial [Taxus chinensis]